MRRAGVLVCLLAVAFSTSPQARASAATARIVVVVIPGFSWDAFARAQHPVLDGLIDTGAVSAVSIRSVSKGSTPVRGYLTLGAGNRGFAVTEPKPRRDLDKGRVALRSSDRFENGTAAQAMTRRVVRPRAGSIVVPDAPALDADQRTLDYGTRIGALGDALARAGVTRAIVTAADLAISPSTSEMRRSAALGVVDRSGTIDSGDVSGLLRSAPDAAYGVETDPSRFAAAVRRALDHARVVLVDPGETLRADEFALDATEREADAQRVSAIQRTDTLIGRVAADLGPRDTLYVVGVSSPIADPRDHLTLAVAHGHGIARGWLTSATTHRAGLITLTDLAPTVLTAVGAKVPSSMSGTAVRAAASPAEDRVATLAALDAQSGFGDRFQGFVAKLLILLLAALAIALASRRSRKLVTWIALAALAIPPLAYVDRMLPLQRTGVVAATVVTAAMAAIVATALERLRIEPWKAGLILVVVSFALTTGDLLAGAPLQVNNVFGYSPISAGRFYGNSNIEFAVLISTALIGAFALFGSNSWTIVVLIGVVVLQGLPQFGADFGGIVASVPAMLVAYALARGRGLRVSRLLAWAAAGVVAAGAVTLFDLSRPPQARTHLGRFAAQLFSGGAGDIIARKVHSNLGILGSVWTLTVPIAIVVAAVVWRTWPTSQRMLTAGLAGALVAGVIGFAVNDTGIWVLGMVLAYAVPVAVLLSIGSSDGRAGLQRPAQEAGHQRQSRSQV